MEKRQRIIQLLGNQIFPIFRIIKLSKDFESNSVELEKVEELTFEVIEGKSYEIKLRANRTSSSITNGAKLALKSSADGFLTGNWDGGVSDKVTATNRTKRVAFEEEYILDTSGSRESNYLKLDAFFTAKTTGKVELYFASEVRKSKATLLEGSALIITTLD